MKKLLIITSIMIVGTLISCQSKKNENKVSEKPKFSLQRMLTYMPKDSANPRQIETLVLAVIQAVEKKGIKFDTLPPDTMLKDCNVHESLDYKADGCFFHCFRLNNKIDDIMVGIGQPGWYGNIEDVIDKQTGQDFGFASIEKEKISTIEITINGKTKKILKKSDSIWNWPGPGFENKYDLGEKDLREINRQYVAFLRYILKELI